MKDRYAAGLTQVSMRAHMGFIAETNGRHRWMEGVQLLAVYAILAVAFFFLPA